MEMTRTLRNLYFYLCEKKAIKKIVITAIVLSFIPIKLIQILAGIALIIVFSAFIAVLMPEETEKPYKSKKKEDDKSPVDEFKLNIMQTKITTLTQSYITKLIESEADCMEWEWYDEYSVQEYCEVLNSGGNVLIHLNSDEYDEARVQLQPIPTIEFINLTHNWFSSLGKEQILEQVYYANSQGSKTLVLNNGIISDFPNKEKWDMISEYLVSEGYKVKLLGEGIEISWPKKSVKKMSGLGGVA